MGLARNRKQTVWVVLHYEIMGAPDSPRIDSLQFHVSSSLKKAERYIRSTGVDAHSWWQVHPYVLDGDGDEGVEVHYYSHRGTPLKIAPMSRAFIAYAKHVARHPEWYSNRPSDQL
jgi:hypothetical protein